MRHAIVRVRRALAGQIPPIHAPVRLRWAIVLVIVWHGGLLLTGTFRGTYDALIHIFLADHYDRSWFSTWDQRWYTGFTTVSYPPGSHMALAAVGKLTGGLDSAFVVVQVFALVNLTVGVYRFSRLWVDEEAAANAALLLVMSSAIAETVHLYGQLPTTFSLGFLLNALPFIQRWIFRGRFVDLVAGTTVLAATTAGHHVTTLFGSVFFLGPVVVQGLLERSRVPRSDEVIKGDPVVGPFTLVPQLARRVRRIAAPAVRTAIFAPCALAALVVVVFPYWYWSATDPITQLAIPHGSRANFLQDLNLGLIFWLIPWGMMLLVLPYALLRSTLDRKWPLAASLALLTLLGTGGTTPLPKLLLGAAFDILTLDRFTFWAAIIILPLAGQMAVSVEHGSIAAYVTETGGRRLLAAIQVSLVVGLLSFALFAGTLNQFRPFQPDPIDPDPMVAFLEKDQHERWRFLTLGFGDQMAWISAQTTATQVDGNYHSVRRLPEMTSTSVERLEGAKYRGVDGLGSLQQFLEVPEKYHLKFVFSNDAFYDPLLHFTGWTRLGPLENGIVVWERADIAPLPAQLPIKEVSKPQRLLWGTLPPSMLVLGLFHITWSGLGRPGLRRRFDEAEADSRVVFGPFRLLDRLLFNIGSKLDDAEVRAPKDPVSTRLLTRVQGHLTRSVSSRRKRARLAVLAVFVLAMPLRSAVTSTAVEVQPGDVVEAYYDHLDFRRWQAAYDLLDPVSRPDFELWRLQLSVNGGILASYAKLNDLEVTEVDDGSDRPDHTVVEADLNYLTALNWYPIERSIDMVRRDGDWFIVPEPPSSEVPPDQLVRRAAVDYLIQGRRRVTSATTDVADVQDRPELLITNASLFVSDGLPVLVGEVVNLDVDPADLTLTAILRDADGGEVVRYNATEEMIRQIRPREATPFRIDFEQVAAGTDLDFDPLDAHPIAFDPELMVTAEVAAKAVVTSSGIERGLGINAIDLVEDDGEWRLDGELRNDSVSEATIPMLLVSFLDDEGDVLWVERFYVDTAIRSQRTGEFSVVLPTETLAGLEESGIEPLRFQNGIVPTEAPQLAPPALIDSLPADFGAAAIRVDIAAFVGSEK